jgi:1-aminocyclopropane-1-carboxylate deaminase
VIAWGELITSAQPLDLQLPSPLEELRDDRLTSAGLRLFLKRDDLISPDIPGNKWRKLKYNLEAARKQGHQVLLTFGGAYSNHIRATAAAGYYFGFATVGVIRGEEHLPLNPSLDYAIRHGMRLAYLDRAAYREKMSPEVIAMLCRRFGEFYLLPEGGSNADALRGCAEIPGEIDHRFDLVCCPCGTGGTLAGLAQGLGPGQRALGFSVLKGGEFLGREVSGLQREAGRASALHARRAGHHRGPPAAGPARTSASRPMRTATWRSPGGWCPMPRPPRSRSSSDASWP